MDDLITDSRYSWVRLGLTLFVATIINAGMWAIIVIMPAIEAEYGGTRAMVSLPYTLTMVGFAFGNYVIGRAVDHFGITASLIVAAIMTAVGFMLATLSSSLLILSFTQLMVGFASAVGFGPLIADISHWFVRRRGIAVAIAASGNYLSGAIWPILLAKVLAENGWRAVYIVIAAVTLVAVIPLAFALRRRLPQEVQTVAQNTSLANAKTVGLSPRTLQYLLGFCWNRLLCGYVDASSSHCCLLCRFRLRSRCRRANALLNVAFWSCIKNHFRARCRYTGRRANFANRLMFAMFGLIFVSTVEWDGFALCRQPRFWAEPRWHRPQLCAGCP